MHKAPRTALAVALFLVFAWLGITLPSTLAGVFYLLAVLAAPAHWSEVYPEWIMGFWYIAVPVLALFWVYRLRRTCRDRPFQLAIAAGLAAGSVLLLLAMVVGALYLILSG